MTKRLAQSVLSLIACALLNSTADARQATELGPARWHAYPEADALSYEIDLVCTPDDFVITGRVRYRFRAVERLSAVRLDSSPGSEWSVVFRQAGELRTRRDGDRLHVQLEEEVAAGEEFELTAELAGTPPDGLYFGKTRYGEPCIYTDHYAVRARGWLPSEDHPADRARFSLRIAVPSASGVVFTGKMARSDEAQTPDWVPDGFALHTGVSATDLPTYLFAFAVTSWERLAESGDGRLVPHFLYREDVDKARGALVHHAAWFRRMEEVIGKYAYAKYCVVQIPTRWGGMENAGNTYLSESIFDGPCKGVGVLAHEFAHQWFGDDVGYADWFEVWLSEGFASYFGPWLDASTGGPPLAQSLASMRERWLDAPVAETLPVRWDGYADPSHALNSNTYPKGAWILHMLRVELGDTDFFEGLRRYYRGHSGTSVTTDDLRRSMQDVCGRDLALYFDQWLNRPGCPQLAFDWADDGVSVHQEQGEPFDFLLPLRWTGDDGVVRERRFRIKDSETRLELDGAPIHSPLVDPNVELLYRDATAR